MTPPRLHLLGIPHARVTDTHCAFTQKVVKMVPMMQRLGYHITYYGIGGKSGSIGADKHVEVLSFSQQEALLGHDFSDATRFSGDGADVGNPVYTCFNAVLGGLLESNVGERDIVLYPFGHAHAPVLSRHKGIAVESGVGYPTCFLPLRIYESNAWLHWHAGKEQAHGNPYHWVIPNYFVSGDWPPGNGAGGYALYFGRLSDLKGLHAIVEVARRMPEQRFVLCGQGDPKPYLQAPNIEYLPPVYGPARAALLGAASVMLAPSQFIEPFCGSAVEAQLAGTPVVCSPFGAFTETVEQGKTGFRCHTLAELVDGVRLATTLDRGYISRRAHGLYSLEAVGPQYDAAFRQIADLHGAGWYSPTNHRFPISG